MNIVKSLAVLGLLGVLVFFSIKCLTRYYELCQLHNKHIKYGLFTTFICCITLTAIIILGKYTYPFDRQVKLELVKTVTSTHEYSRFHGTWFGVYQGSEGLHKTYIDQWMDIDTENYSYIVSFGYPIDSLSFNVWKRMDGTYQGGIYAGHAVTGQLSDPVKIYIYRIPHLYIDNNEL